MKQVIQSMYDVDWAPRILIEASAGTGKTYTLAALYVRLLVEKNLDADQILVMTFTRKATSELRDRIFKRLRECLAVIEGDEYDQKDQFLVDFIARVSDLATAREKLRGAIRNFDDSQVFTIHGFCQKVLQEEALRAGTPFDVEVVQQDDLLTEAVEDFWRSFMNRYGGTEAGRYYISKLLEIAGSPAKFKEKLRLLFSKSYAQREGMGLDDPVQYLVDVLSVKEKIAGTWEKEQTVIKQELIESDLSGYTANAVGKIEKELDEFIGDSGFSKDSFKKLEKLISRNVYDPNNLKKNGSTIPNHDFFEICDQYFERIQQIDRVKTSIISDAYEEISSKREDLLINSNTETYDDLLRNVQSALHDPETGKKLSKILNRKYPVALVDEFQDTDPVQYSIFDAIYPEKSTGSNLLMIGDPKQAIYAFRGADVYAYLKARDRESVNKYTLEKNFRSAPVFNQAVNTLFSYSNQPFIQNRIEYLPVEDGKPELESQFTVDGDPAGGIQIISKTGIDTSKTDSADFTLSQTATEIASLLQKAESGAIKIGDRKLRAGDIAVLVSTHKYADDIKRRLKKLGIDSVTYSQEKVFETAEARRLEQLMAAVLDPYNRIKVNNALLSGFWGQNLNELYEYLADDNKRQQLIEELQELNEIWFRDGFYSMFRAALFSDNQLSEIAAISNSERILTNLYQLADIGSKAEKEGGFDPHATYSWFVKEMADPGSGRDDEKTLLLESDQNLVKVSTIHNSKGLEFPVVFCPTLWDVKTRFRNNLLIEYHKADFTPAIRMDQDDNDERAKALRKSEIESIAEEVRKCYVAITRAKYRCVIPWANYHQSTKSGFGASLIGAQLVTELSDNNLKLKKSNKFSDESFRNIFDDLRKQSQGAVELKVLESVDVPEQLIEWKSEETDRLNYMPYNGRQMLEVQHPVESFSSLAHHSGDPAQPDYDQVMDSYISAVHQVRDRDENKERTIFDFPKGAVAGTAIHKIFEHDSFQFDTAEKDDHSEFIENVLIQYNIDTGWTTVVQQMIRNVVLSDIPELELGKVRSQDQLREMEFHFLAKQPSLKNILGIIRKDSEEPLPGHRKKSFLTGFIDLVVRQNGKYYILDYKSNYLGDAVEDYNTERLKEEILEASYDLQYHLYTVALATYLKSRNSDFDYQHDFGGVIYLFVRGMRKGEKHGIWFHKPDAGVIKNLEEELEVSV